MKIINFTLLLCFLIMPALVTAQRDTTKKKQRKRINVTGLPVVAYDADMGFQYGVIGEIYDYGDWSMHPEYRHVIKLEVSRFTKGSGVNQLFYDSKYLIPGNIRLTADVSYLTEKGVDFYGFNGYQAMYQPSWEDDEDIDNYISRMFYRHERKMFRFTCDLQGPILGEKLRWLGGLGIMNFKVGPVDIDRLNEGKKEEDLLPDTISLFEQYKDWGVIPAQDTNGGNANFFKAGIIYDTRDNEPNPMRGLWEEALLIYSPGFFFNDNSFLKLVLIHRQYFTLVKKKLSFVYRLGYQGTIAGNTPFYFQPYMLTSFSSVTKTDGLGGAKNLRGILRNRVVGDGVAWGNVEFRWRMFDFRIGKQKFYLGLNTFCDAGMVVQKIDFDESLIPEEYREDYFDFTYENDGIHPSVGAGLRIGWNENTIIAIDYGFALNSQDGLRGLYINIGNLF